MLTLNRYGHVQYMPRLWRYIHALVSSRPSRYARRAHTSGDTCAINRTSPVLWPPTGSQIGNAPACGSRPRTASQEHWQEGRLQTRKGHKELGPRRIFSCTGIETRGWNWPRSRFQFMPINPVSCLQGEKANGEDERKRFDTLHEPLGGNCDGSWPHFSGCLVL